jgi:hypothetical protein
MARLSARHIVGVPVFTVLDTVNNEKKTGQKAKVKPEGLIYLLC